MTNNVGNKPWGYYNLENKYGLPLVYNNSGEPYLCFFITERPTYAIMHSELEGGPIETAIPTKFVRSVLIPLFPATTRKISKVRHLPHSEPEESIVHMSNIQYKTHIGLRFANKAEDKAKYILQKVIDNPVETIVDEENIRFFQLVMDNLELLKFGGIPLPSAYVECEVEAYKTMAKVIKRYPIFIPEYTSNSDLAKKIGTKLKKASKVLSNKKVERYPFIPDVLLNVAGEVSNA